jgi:hypothetical protein
LDAPERSDPLKLTKDPAVILKSFKTMFVNAEMASHFKSAQLKAALARNKGFGDLNVRIVDDYRIADVILDVGYTFAWDFPFALRHQNTPARREQPASRTSW